MDLCRQFCGFNYRSREKLADIHGNRKNVMAPYPKPTKREKKKARPIYGMTSKRAALEKRKNAAYIKIPVVYCEGCGTSQNLSRSHTIPVGKRLEFIDDLRNIHILCMDRCHPAVESNRFWILENGRKIVEDMLLLDFQYGLGRLFKMREIFLVEEINIDDLPEWVRWAIKLLD